MCRPVPDGTYGERVQRRDPLRISAVLGLVLAVVVLLVPTAGAAGSAVEGRGARPCTQVELVAHRGLHNKRHTEDTLAAFANAINRGVGVIDGDLRLSGDGSWVFLHDPTIGRTTHGRGSVHQSDAYLASVRNNDGRIGLTFLPPALQLLAGHPGVRFEIEVKPAD
ncbi:MAG: glycerophosphodiester phosphodiesterase, partial [Nocardioidaceae bacterium]|nr:glycerophosphodiester phosphodiesterase [Nocardioidaceae bacterium]